MEQKEEKYSISLIERQSDLHADFIYQRKDIDQDKTANVFITVNETRNTSIFEDERFVFYWELQSFLAKMLIKLNKKEIKNDMKVTIGFNGYPQQYRYTDTTGYGIAAFLSFMLALQFSLIGYNFNMRMIDEKENKLNILLERQGISKFKYFLSWFVTFYVIFSFSILSYGIFLYLSVRNRLTLLFLTMVLYTLSIFTSSIFFTTITKSAKTGTSAVKFFNFGSILMGFVIVLPKTARMTKYFFGLIPAFCQGDQQFHNFFHGFDHRIFILPVIIMSACAQVRAGQAVIGKPAAVCSSSYRLDNGFYADFTHSRTRPLYQLHMILQDILHVIVAVPDISTDAAFSVFAVQEGTA